MRVFRWPQGVAVVETQTREQTQSDPGALPNGGQATRPHLVVLA